MSEEQEDQANSSSSEKIQLHKRNSSNSNISNLRWSNSWEDFTKYATQPYHEHPSLDGSSCGGNAFRSFLNSFIIAYGLRTSLSIILRFFFFIFFFFFLKSFLI